MESLSEGNKRKATMRDYYSKVSKAQRGREVAAELVSLKRSKKMEKGRQPKKSPGHEISLALLTQNVRGFSKAGGHMTEWFQSFRQRADGVQADMVLLQETHVTTQEATATVDAHCRHWGFDPRTRSSPLSFWSPADDKRGGVGILLNPHSAIADVQPVYEEYWSPHWMAVSAKMDGVMFHVINIYAPTQRAEREELFREIQVRLAGTEAPLLIGGDFNSTQIRTLDRTYVAGSDIHRSGALAQLLLEQTLTDAAEDAISGATTAKKISQFHSLNHTYFYKLPDDTTASSRLDRWYVSAQMYTWVTKVQAVIPGPASDHNGVVMLIRNPQRRRQRKSNKPLYPVPMYAASSADAAAKVLLESFERELSGVTDELLCGEDQARAWATKWDDLKVSLRCTYRHIRRECKRKALEGHRQRMRRLSCALKRLSDKQQAIEDRSGQPEDGAVDVSSIRADIARRTLAAQTKRGTLLLVAHSTRASTTKDFFRRISTRHLDNTVVSLQDEHGVVHMESSTLPNVMAEGWKSIIDPKVRSIDWSKPSVHQFAPVKGLNLKPIGAVPCPLEVDKAIKCCKRGKSPGPDGLGNDWYRDHSQWLGPILTRLFALWTDCSIFPASFTTAFILGLKKKRDARRPLDFRPIALLNTDYKVYTRIFATRVRGKAASLVHEMQNGFVPGRTIHTTLDAYFAVKAMVTAGRLPSSVIALMLDFAKAYDSLSREYLLWVLKEYGFPQKFVDIVEALHRGTTYKFLVNGFESRTVNVTTGIRQGCPLAPLLFILALDPLYRAIEASPRLRGLSIPNGEDIRMLKAAGYADDTTLYLNSVTELPAALDLLKEYGDLSGLKVNLSKSTGVYLVPQQQGEESTHCGIRFLKNDDSCRYLGIRVGCGDTHAENWSNCLQATAGRVALAVSKTHTVLQRVQIAKSIIVSKILFVARHEWPTRTMVTQLHLMIKRFVWGTKEGTTRRAWVNEHVAGMKLSEGGIGFPYILGELQVMCAKVVADWAASPRAPGAHFNAILLDGCGNRNTYITPQHMNGQATIKYHPSMRATGAAVLQIAHRRVASDTLRTAMDTAAPVLFRCVNSAQWREEQLHIRFSENEQSQVRRLLRVHRTEFGRNDDAWLKHVDVTTPGALWMDSHTQLRVRDWTYCGGATTIRELLCWKWISQGEIAFQPVRRHYPLTNEHAIQFRRLCGALLVTYPHILTRPQREDRLVQFVSGQVIDSEWELQEKQGNIRILHNENESTASARIVSMTQCDDYARKMEGQKGIQFHAHPRLTRLVQTWGGSQRWMASRRIYKRVVREARRKKGVRDLERRADRWEEADAVIGGALREVEWTDIHRLAPGSHMELQTAFRLKAAGFSRWTGDGDSSRCIHADCTVGGLTTYSHWFWTCAAAQRAWRHFLTPWARIHGDIWQSLQSQVFGLRLGRLPAFAAALLVPDSIQQADRNAYLDAILSVLQHAWTGTVLSILHGIWVWRTGLAFDTSVSSQQQWAKLVTRVQSRIRALPLSFKYSGDTKQAAAARDILHRLAALQTEIKLPNMTPSATHGSQFVCFFDGGSRGNPGPGGSGSVVVQVHTATRTANIVWCACMAYSSKTTTNNVAEYWGLIHGLQHAHAHKLQPLHVVGDSALILAQVEQHRLPKAQHLQPLYLRARRLATETRVTSWTHHLRAYNKMADAAANVAMDSRTSLQCAAPDLRNETGHLQQHLTGDITHWFDQVDGL